MIPNRADRAIMEEVAGSGLVREIERYNDRAVDSLASYGVDLDPREELIQQQMLELMAVEEEAVDA